LSLRTRPTKDPLTELAARLAAVGGPDALAVADGLVRLRDVADPAHPRLLGQALSGSFSPVGSVAFSPDGHTLASGDADGAVRLWNMNVQYAVQRICATTGGLAPRQRNHYISQLRYQPSCIR
jgi:hypothetical protein